MSVIVCHLFMATNHEFPFLLQLRSMTSLFLWSPSAQRTSFNRSIENLPFGKRYDVIITYYLTLAKRNLLVLEVNERKRKLDVASQEESS